jgi:hypothetical protein
LAAAAFLSMIPLLLTNESSFPISFPQYPFPDGFPGVRNGSREILKKYLEVARDTL